MCATNYCIVRFIRSFNNTNNYYYIHDKNDTCLRFLPPSSTGAIARVRVSTAVGRVQYARQDFLDVGVLDFTPNTGRAPLSANRRGASTSAASRPMGSQRIILLLNFLVEGRRHEHLPPTNLGWPGDRPTRLSNEGNDKTDPPTCQKGGI